MTTRKSSAVRSRTATQGRLRRLRVEPLEQRLLLAAFSHLFEDINPDTSDADNVDPIAASGGRVNFMSGVPGDTQTFYAASEFGGLYKSTDGGQSWGHVDSHLPQVMWDVEVDPGNASRLYATSFYDGRLTPLSGIQISNDAGATWNRPPSSYPDPLLEGTLNDNTPQAGYNASTARRTEPSAFGIAIRPDAPNEVYVGTNAGLAISLDSGATWNIRDPELGVDAGDDGTAGNVWDVVVQPALPGFPLGIIDIVGDDGHLRSTDQGLTWTRPDTLGTLPTGRATIAVSPDESYVLFVAASDNNLYESNDGGVTWLNLGTPDRRRQGRLQWVQTNQRTDVGPSDVFDVWFGDVGLFRAQCTSLAAPGGAQRCPNASQTPGTPPPAPWAGTFTRAAGAHDDVGDVIFDTTVTTDACPLIFSNDGGIYYNSDTNSPTCHSPSWEEPDPTPHALWLFGMTCVDVAGDDDEHCYFGAQDNGLFASTDAGAASPSWHNTWGADSFDIAADDDTVLYNRGSFGSPGRSFRMFLGAAGAPGFDPLGTEINTYPAGGLLPLFRFTETVANYADDSYVMLTNDCTDPSVDGLDNDMDGMVDNELSNGCPVVAASGSDGGVFVTSDITANPIVWTELADNLGNEPFNSAALVGVEVAVDAGVPTFYAQVGALSGNGGLLGGDARSADQLWKYVGAAANGTWTRIDSNIPGNGVTKGIGVFGVDPNNSNRLYASADPTGAPAMFFSTDGGVSWNSDPVLDNSMQGGGVFPYLNQRGPTRFFGFNGYPQPSLVAFDGEDSNNIVAAGQDSGIFLSTDSGQSWRLLTDPFGTADDPSTPGDDVPHIPRPRYAHFDHEPTGETRIYIGSQGYGMWRITVDFDKPADTFEEGTNNNSLGTATILGSLPEVTLRDLSIHNGSDVDFYKYTAHDSGKLIVNAFFDGLAGDLDIRVRDRSGNIIASGAQGNIAPQLDSELVVIPVVAQEEYFIEVFSSLGHTNCYDLEIENIAAPTPIAIDLAASNDSGMSDADNVTSEDEGTITILADLFDFDSMGINVLTPTDVTNGLPGAAVIVFVGGQSVGVADPQGGSDSTLFTFDFDAGDLSQGLNVVTAAVRIYDGQSPQVSGRSQFSTPLFLTLDSVPPSAPAAPDLLTSSDTGMANDDNVTNKMSPAFSGATEPNAKVRVKADGAVVGQGVATSSGAWEVTVEPLADGVYDIVVEAEDLAGNVSLMSAVTEVEIDTAAPNTPFLDLVEDDDSGRHDDDNITQVDSPLLSATTHDSSPETPLFEDNLKYRLFDRLEESNEVLLFSSFDEIGDFTSLTHIFTTVDLQDGDTVLGPLADGIHNLKLEIEDRAGNISHDFLLNLLIDTMAPDGTLNLHPDSDSGIWGFPETMTDQVTSDKTPRLYGRAEANALVRVEIEDGTPAGTTVAVPLDGDDGFPPPDAFDGNYLLETILNLEDGQHTITAFFQDVAGNETESDDAPTLDIFVDTQGPQITNVTDGRVSTLGAVSVFDGETSVFDPKPAGGPDPLVHSIVIHFLDEPDRTDDFQVDALFQEIAEEEGNYRLTGDAHGEIAILAVNVVFTTVAGQPAVATAELVLHDLGADEIPFTDDDGLGGPLPDDRFTLWVSDSIADPAGNPLDGESGALAPFEGNDVPEDTPPIFPTGDGAHGGDFHARFTVDSRPEIGTFLGDGTWYVDLNGNGVFDPNNVDPTHRDIVWKFGTKDDLPVTGDWDGDGDGDPLDYDEIGLLGKRSGKDFFFLDLDRNGAFDPAVDASFEFKMNGAGNGLPIAGDWDGDGSDEVAALKGSSWFIDDSGSPYTPALTIINPTKISTSMKGEPIVGDWDGDGDDNVGTFYQDQFFLDTDDDFSEAELIVTFPEFDFGGLKPQPVAHDWDQDGDDDIGLFVRRETGNNSGTREAGEWFLDVNTDLSVIGTIEARFEPPPTGLPGVPLVNQDIFYNFGDEREPAALNGLIPVVGNFDPPIGASQTIRPVALYTNESNNLDVNNDGHVTSGDALVVVNDLNAHGARKLPVPARPRFYTDVNGDGSLAPLDALVIVNVLNGRADLTAEGESPFGGGVPDLPVWRSSTAAVAPREATRLPALAGTPPVESPIATPDGHTAVRADRAVSEALKGADWEDVLTELARDLAELSRSG